MPTPSKTAFLAVSASMLAAFSLPGCSAPANPAAPAAICDGQVVSEQQVTESIDKFRADNGLEDDGKWARWMLDNDRDAAEMRREAIDYSIRQIAIGREVRDRGLAVGDAEVEKEYESNRKMYGYADEKGFEDAIEARGYSVPAYKETIRSELLEEKLAAAIASGSGSGDPDGAVVDLANGYTEALDGSKLVRCIVMRGNETGKAAMLIEQVRAGADFDRLADVNSASSSYDGWTAFSPQEPEVEAALENMGKGDVSDVIASGNKLFIVKVEDVCSVPQGGFTSPSQMPESLVAYFEKNAEEARDMEAFEDYISARVAAMDVKVNPMPKGLPYDVDMTLAESAAE